MAPELDHRPFQFPDDDQVLVSLSGGRTSAYMLYRCLLAHDFQLPDGWVVTFANTGREHPATLDFVQRCQEEWNCPIVWLEFDPNQKPPYRRVSHNSASRDGEPYDAIIRQKGYLPNTMTRFCTTELKIRTMQRYVVHEHGFKDWINLVGLRADEPKRLRTVRARNDSGKDPWETVTPLGDVGVTEFDVDAFWRQQPFDLQLPAKRWGNCDYCLAAETEVVTDEGIKPIASLVNTTPNLLVPKVAHNGATNRLTEVGRFKPATVRSFGVQRLWRVDLYSHGGSRMSVYATAEHRWFLGGKRPRSDGAVTTESLQPGDRLRSLNRSPNNEGRSSVSTLGALRGFVYGDGTVVQNDARPARVDIHEGKDEVFKPYFDVLCGEGRQTVRPNYAAMWTYNGLPRFWKLDRPSLKDSRDYLLGWLAGWFAADGCVSTDGVCTLHSASETDITFALSLCAVLGIKTGNIGLQDRDVTFADGSEYTAHRLYKLNLSRACLPQAFFWLPHHRERIDACAEKQVREYRWIVDRVEPTERVEEVYCAVVEGEGAFGIAGGLMTGNCFLKGQEKLRANMLDAEHNGDGPRPDWWIQWEREEAPKLARKAADALTLEDAPDRDEETGYRYTAEDKEAWVKMERQRILNSTKFRNVKRADYLALWRTRRRQEDMFDEDPMPCIGCTD